MAIEVAAPIVEFLSLDRTTAGVKATGSITYLTGGSDTETLTISDSNQELVFETLTDPTDPTAGTTNPLPIFDSTWELQAAIDAVIAGALDIGVTNANVGAEATVTFTTGAPTDDALVTVTDALGNAIGFEFSDGGDGTTGDVQVTNGADQESAAAAFEVAVNAAFAGLGPNGEDTITAVHTGTTTSVVTLTGAPEFGLETQVSADPVETVADGNIACAVWGNSSLADGLTKTDLEAAFKGTQGNETIAETGSVWTVTGMSSGTNAVVTVGLNDTVGTPEMTIQRYNDGSVKWTAANGIARHAHSNQFMVRELYDAIKAIVTA